MVLFINDYILPPIYISLDSSLRETKPETLLEAYLERLGLSYLAQKPIAGTVLVDIFIEPDICIFVDGNYWHNYPLGLEKDQRQTRLLESWGYRVVRIWEHEILENPENIIIKLIKELKLNPKYNLEEFFG